MSLSLPIMKCQSSVQSPLRRSKSSLLLCAMTFLSMVAACQTFSRPRVLKAPLFLTDSTQIAVRSGGHGYAATIEYTFVNTAKRPVSRVGGCGGQFFPDLEKKVGTKWVVAYYPIYLLCTGPDFVLTSGPRYHGILKFVAYEPGHNTGPELRVDSVDGVYRLRLGFVLGAKPRNGARTISAVSNEFRMTVMSKPTASNTR